MGTSSDRANPSSPGETRRVLIVSSHPLFGQGLRSLLQARPETDVSVVGMVSSVDEAIAALEALHPDLVIVDYDDERVNRDEFLARFVEGAMRMRVVLLSLKEGGSQAIVYDRWSLAASQIDDWLKEWTYSKGGDVVAGEVTPAPPANLSGQKTGMRRSNMKHLVFVAILVAALTALLILGLNSVQLLPIAASEQAKPIDRLFDLEFKVIAFLFSLIVGFMLYSIVAFRRRKGDLGDGPHMEGNTRLEVLWTVIPLVMVLALAVLGSQALAKTMEPAPKPMRVRVVGAQWSWRFEYPDYGIVSTELFLPVNKQVLLELTSSDVIHSFWVPEFRVKQDLLPGGDKMVRQLRITPDRVGEYKVRCAELCGKLHYSMEAPVKVVELADFDAWVNQQVAALSDDPVVRGQTYAQKYGCTACHSVDGSKIVGPSWKGIYGGQETIQDGTAVTVDNTYLVESIIDPGAKITQGYANIMPATFKEQLTDDQIADIIAFIASLK